MKLLFKLIKEKIILFLTNEKQRILNFYKNKSLIKKTIIYSLLTLILMSLGCYTAILCTSVLPANKTQTITEIITNNDAGNMLGFIYGYETSQNTYELCSTQPELSKQLRSVKRDWEIYDVYPNQFKGSTPAFVDYIDQSSVSVSFLLLPKENYTNSYFDPLYSFELLCGGPNKESNSEDIYINQKYADYLLYSRGLPQNDYSSLLDEPEIRLPYINQYTESKKYMTYILKGVIKEDSPKYQEYKKFFGDFFLANQYLSLPLSNGTCFTLPNNANELRERLDLIFKIYDYKTAGRFFNALNFAYKYDFRTVGIDQIGTSKSISELFNEHNSYYSSLNSIYDYYFNKQFIIPFVILLVFDLIIFMINIWSFFKAVRYSPISISALTLISCCLLSSFIGLAFNAIPFLKEILKIPLSTHSWQAFLIMIIQLILIILISIGIHCFNKKKLKSENEE